MTDAAPLPPTRLPLAESLVGLDDEQWATASRCEGWTVQDVVAHLVDTNQFWTLSIGAARRGEPTQFLSTFDPVATPAALVEGARGRPSDDVLDRFVSTTESFAEAIADLDEESWAVLAEAPPGHVPIRALALHALWDSWVHERDVLLPLGLTPVEEPSEIVASRPTTPCTSPGRPWSCSRR